MPRNDSVGPRSIALAGVVVDDVEDHLDAGIVQRADCALQPDHAGRPEIARLGREIGERRVAPVVAQSLLDKEAVVGEGMDRQELDRGDAELDEMLDHGRVAEGVIGAADRLRHSRMELGQALHMGLVDDGVGQRAARRAVVAPVMGRVLDDAFRHHRRAVAPVGGEVAAVRAHAIAEQRIVPADAAEELARIGIDQELVRIEAVAVARVVGSVHAIAVELARAKALDIDVPDLVRAARQRDAVGLPAARAGRTGTARRRSAFAENSAKFTPFPSKVAPSGAGLPSSIRNMLVLVAEAARTSAEECTTLRARRPVP